jgi:hypothetical protein
MVSVRTLFKCLLAVLVRPHRYLDICQETGAKRFPCALEAGVVNVYEASKVATSG